MYGEKEKESIEEQILQFPRCTGKRVAGNLRLTFSGRDYRTYCIATLLNSALNFREDLRKGRSGFHWTLVVCGENACND